MHNQKEVKFLPFHAINDFMLDDFRQDVIRGTMEQLDGLPEDIQSSIHRLTKKLVRVPGFRNSVKAPLSIKIKPMMQGFEKSPAFVAAILEA